MSPASRVRTRWLVATLAVVLVGLVTTVVWLVVNPRTALRVTVTLAWIPAVVVLVGAAAVALGVFVTSLTAQKVAAAAARIREEESQRRRRLMSRLDHELKNPIQGIRAALADEPTHWQRQSIADQATRLSSLLSDLRKITEVENATLEVEEVNISALVEEVAHTAGEIPGASQRHIDVSLPRAPRPLPHIYGDGDLLFLALSNVVSNAIKYSQPGARIEIRGREDSGFIVLECADTGRGIPADELETVWEELGRSREVRGTEGSGLGLPMVRAIIERHGGTATLNSWHGQGSTVTLRLPITPVVRPPARR